MDLTNTLKAEDLKKMANDEYGNGNYEAAIKTYTEILALPGIPADLQATIYSNRSAAFLCKDNKSMAIKDAEMAIQLRPSWSKAYYRLGCAFDADNKLEKAIAQFEAALALNPEEKSIKEKITKAMMNLAKSYLKAGGTGKLEEGNKEKALHWLRRAASLGDVSAEIRYRELKRFNDTVGGSGDQFLKEHQHLIPPIQDAAEQGSIVANDLLTIMECMEDAMDAFKQGNHAKMIAQMAKAIRLEYQLVEMPEMFKPLVQKCIKAQPNNIDAIVCLIRGSMSTKDGDLELAKFVDKSLQMFPNDPFLLEIRGMCFLRLKQPKEAINLLEAALKKHPNNVRLLFVRADACRYVASTKMMIEAWDDFLRVAPKDHPKVPAAYYWKSAAYFNSPVKSVQCFEQGLAAEKLQFPGFLPYDFPGKCEIEKNYNEMKLKLKENEKSKENKAGSSTSSAVKDASINSAQREHIISNPRRKMLLNNLRGLFASQIESGQQKNPHLVTEIAPRTPKPASMIGVVEITLDEMEPDNIYNRSILELKIIDWPVVLNSVMMAVEDKNGHIEKLAIYNWPESDDLAKTLQTFRPQRTLHVINPYLLIGLDQERLIRVEDPSYLILGELPPIKKHICNCNCCGVNDEVAKILKCAKCKMAYYCSKECQKMDWNEFGHKLVCKHLATFSDAVFGQQQH